MLVVGSEVQVNACPVVLFGTIESCTRAPKGYVVSVHVAEVVNGHCTH